PHRSKRHLLPQRMSPEPSLERDVFPLIGSLPPGQINPRVVLHVLNQIQERGAVETAHRVRQRMSDVFVHAVATGRADHDPAAIVKAALRPVQRGRQPAITDIDQAREMIMKVEQSAAHPVTLLAFRLLYLTAVRPGEVRGALWQEFHDLQGKEPVWVIPAERMKMGRYRYRACCTATVKVSGNFERYCS
ncbi:MAG: hypothetical protein ABF759_12380, partial [Acetobacter malorum]|uniref:tyrosine-type recombinase/integrase n=1 Tax=Acetobacter malorum TaxID=178901 RepID=UPI0039E865DC